MNKLIRLSEIQGMIVELRGQRVILDSDLAMLYQVPAKRLMEQVRRNIKRFPQDFMFRLTKDEWHFLRSQIATFGGKALAKKYLPYQPIPAPLCTFSKKTELRQKKLKK